MSTIGFWEALRRCFTQPVGGQNNIIRRNVIESDRKPYKHHTDQFKGAPVPIVRHYTSWLLKEKACRFLAISLVSLKGHVLLSWGGMGGGVEWRKERNLIRHLKCQPSIHSGQPYCYYRITNKRHFKKRTNKQTKTKKQKGRQRERSHLANN